MGPVEPERPNFHQPALLPAHCIRLTGSFSEDTLFQP